MQIDSPTTRENSRRREGREERTFGQLGVFVAGNDAFLVTRGAHSEQRE